MSELANYSIETDQMVWLSFKNGQNFRVAVGQLPRYLTPHDLKRVRRAVKLRKDFFKQHMPKTLLILAAFGLTSLAVTSGQMLAELWQPKPSLTPPSGDSELVRNTIPEAAAPTSAPIPPATPVAGVTLVRRAAAVKPRIPTVAPAAPRATTPAVVVTPIPSGANGEITTVASPSPSPVPGPATPPQPTPAPGQVLGDSTGPTPSPAPASPSPTPVH